MIARDYRVLVFKHANLKRDVSIVAGTIAGWHYSDASKCTYIYTIAGIFPVLETEAEINRLLDKAVTKSDEETK